MTIHAEDLDSETKRKLNLGDLDEIDPRVLALGDIIRSLRGLTKADALWALKTAVSHVRGRRNQAEKGPNVKRGGSVEATSKSRSKVK